MAQVIDIVSLVREEVRAYVRPSPTSTAYYLEDEAKQIYAVVAAPKKQPGQPFVIVMARLSDGQIIIEGDITDKPLHDALKQAGVPADQIVLKYE
jgi:hypothetical protein